MSPSNRLTQVRYCFVFTLLTHMVTCWYALCVKEKEGEQNGKNERQREPSPAA
jgi:hypothetical protein